jgi:hypothetical protein
VMYGGVQRVAGLWYAVCILSWSVFTASASGEGSTTAM